MSDIDIAIREKHSIPDNIDTVTWCEQNGIDYKSEIEAACEEELALSKKAVIDFEDTRKHLIGQTERLVLELREKLLTYDKEDIFGEDAAPLGSCVEAIVACHDGLKKLANVMEFIDAWQENGDIPSLGLVDDDQVLKNFN